MVTYMKFDPTIDDRERALALCLELGLPVASMLASLAQLQAALAHEFARGHAPAMARALAWADAASAAADQMARVLADGRARVLREPLAPRRLELGMVLRCAAALSAGEAAGRAHFAVETCEAVWLVGNGAQLVQSFSRLLLHLTASLPEGGHLVQLRIERHENRATVEIEAEPAAGAAGLTSLVPPPDAASLTLGLTMARRIFAEHGGSLELARDPNRPRTRVNLPVEREARR
jgi:hypothetical protein